MLESVKQLYSNLHDTVIATLGMGFHVREYSRNGMSSFHFLTNLDDSRILTKCLEYSPS